MTIPDKDVSGERVISAETYWAHIYIAGDIQQARQACREFCARGLCVTVESVYFIYTGGEEAGVRVGIINYPKFPSDQATIQKVANGLAKMLRIRLFQDSYSVVFPDKTIWESTR